MICENFVGAKSVCYPHRSKLVEAVAPTAHTLPPQLINFKSYSTVKPFGIGCQKILRLTVFQLIGQFKKAVIHTIELDRYEIDLKQKRSECERWNDI